MLRSITFEPLVRWARNFAQTFGQQSSNCKQIFALLPTRIAELRRIYREFLRYFTPASYQAGHTSAPATDYTHPPITSIYSANYRSFRPVGLLCIALLACLPPPVQQTVERTRHTPDIYSNSSGMLQTFCENI